MTAVRTGVLGPVASSPDQGPARLPESSGPRRLRRWVKSHWVGIAFLLPVLVLVGAVHAWGCMSTRSDSDEKGPTCPGMGGHALDPLPTTPTGTTIPRSAGSWSGCTRRHRRVHPRPERRGRRPRAHASPSAGERHPAVCAGPPARPPAGVRDRSRPVVLPVPTGRRAPPGRLPGQHRDHLHPGRLCPCPVARAPLGRLRREQTVPWTGRPDQGDQPAAAARARLAALARIRPADTKLQPGRGRHRVRPHRVVLPALRRPPRRAAPCPDHVSLADGIASSSSRAGRVAALRPSSPSHQTSWGASSGTHG